MHTKIIATAALFAITVNSQATGEPAIDAADIEQVIPTEFLAPAAATSIAAVADSFIASVTAAPEFSSVVSVLATGIPITAQIAIQNDPEGFLLDIVQGSSLPSWITELPPSVTQYIESIGQDAANIVTSDFPGLYTSLSSEVAAFETSAAVSGGYAYPTGGYGTGNTTAPRPTGSAPAPGSPPQSFSSSAFSLRAGSMIAGVVTVGMGVGAWLMV